MTGALETVHVAGQVRPRSLFCPIAERHRNRAVAEAVCRGAFTHAGVTVQLGPEPDWDEARRQPDEEWHIGLSKFYEGLDLAAAFQETRDVRFLRAWERLVGSWIRQVPVGSDSSDVAGRRIQNWIYAWAGFASAPGFPGLDPGNDALILASIDEQARHVREHLTPERNHRTLELYGLFVVALALPELDPSGERLAFALAGLDRNLRTDFRPDGVHRESSTHYHLIVLRSFVALRENARRFGLALPEGFDERLERACEFALHCHRPDGAIPALSDSDTDSYLDVLALAGSLLERPDFTWAATAGASGRPPRERRASFPDGGYFFQRSGWGERETPFRDERFLVFDCGPLGDGGHGHYDALSVELAAGGRPLVLDPGRFTYSEAPPNLRRWFKGTAAHNTVCVDGLDQTAYRRGRPKGPTAEARFLGRATAAGLDVLRGEVVSPCYDAVHRRRVVFVADEYWLIEDRLVGDRPHSYDLRFHLAPEAAGVARADAGVVVAPGLALVVSPALPVRLEEGSIAPRYGEKLAAPVVSVVSEGSAATTFTTLAWPRPDGGAAPSLAHEDRGGSTVVEVRHPDGRTRDVVAWADEAAELELGPVRCRAEAAWIRLVDGARVAFGAAGAGP